MIRSGSCTPALSPVSGMRSERDVDNTAASERTPSSWRASSTVNAVVQICTGWRFQSNTQLTSEFDGYLIAVGERSICCGGDDGLAPGYCQVFLIEQVADVVCICAHHLRLTVDGQRDVLVACGRSR